MKNGAEKAARGHCLAWHPNGRYDRHTMMSTARHAMASHASFTSPLLTVDEHPWVLFNGQHDESDTRATDS